MCALVHVLYKANIERTFENVCLGDQTFSKVLSIVALYSTCNIERTFENVCLGDQTCTN